MIELFKEEVKIGDNVKLILTTGKEPVGEVVEIGSNHILIRSEDGKSTRIFEILIGGWELIIANEVSTIKTEIPSIPKENKLENTVEIQLVQTDTPESIIIQELKIDNNNPEPETENKSKIGVKVVGKIVLAEEDIRKKRFPSGRTYRLRQIAREFNTSINLIVDLLAKWNILIDKDPNTKIDQKAYDILIQNRKALKKSDNQEEYANPLSEIEPLGLKLNSLSQLKKLREKIDINVGKQTLPGNATIKRYGALHQYGFVSDKDGMDFHFNYNEIQDSILLEKLQNFGAEGLQLICQLNNSNGRLIAKRLYLPQTVDFFQDKAEKSYANKNYSEALEIAELILTHFPDYSQSIELKNKIKIKIRGEHKFKSLEHSNYSLAKIEQKKGNIDLAKKFFLKAIEFEDQKSESSIKELSYILSGEGLYDQAIELVKFNAEKIKFSDPNSLIAYFFEAKKEYPSAIEYLRKINPKSEVEDLKLAKRLALCYFGIANYKLAEQQIDKALRIQPKDTVANKLKQALDIAKAEGSEEEIESIFKEAEISAITGGLSKYIYYTLENCEYAGVPAFEVAKGKLDRKTLKNLKKYIETIKDGRPRERAEAYLSEAKIEQLLDPENSRAINASLAKYCTSIALSWATDGRHVDTLRYFILEAAALAQMSDMQDLELHYITIYLHSFSLSSFEAKSKRRQSWSELIEEVVSDNDSSTFWFGVLDLLLVNSKFSTRFLTSIFNNEEYRGISLSFLLPYLDEKVDSEMNRDLFLKLWKKAREKLKREKDTLSAKLLSLEQSKSTEALAETFLDIKRLLPEWIGQLDRQRMDSIKDIIESILEFNKQPAFEDKERYYNIIISQLSHLKEEIHESPTEVSFNVLNPVIDFTDNLIVYEFKNVIETSKPVIKIQIYGEGSINKSTGQVDVQFSLSNKKGRAPISYLELNVIEENGIEFIKENNIVNQSLRGGDEKVIKLKLKIKKELIDEGATNLKLSCLYKIRGSEELLNQVEELTLRFYSITDFEKIENPFAATADSGPVENASMFFGREDFISNIRESIVNSKSKCVIIYGQKRSGKSSVLHHLRKTLNNSPNTFCISFSLGEIIEDLSPKTFYYTILTEIEDSLASLSEKNENTPEFTAPEYSELNDAPAILFNDQIKSLKREFNRFPEWSNKKLVLLIDEFTYIYYAIQKGYLSEQFMKTWKSFLEKGFFSSVLIGQDIMPKFKAAYPNEFGVTEDKRLSYLRKTDAIKLIEEPIWDRTKNRSRFLGKATELILDYTSSNPYYVQIFCARLVDYMNDNKAISVTEADVHDVAQSFIRGEQALPADKFDNLITAGDADLDAFNGNDVLSALKAIAIASKNLDSCPREAINLGEVDYEENILKDLKDREVLSTPQPGYFKINVRLFKEWLLIN